PGAVDPLLSRVARHRMFDAAVDPLRARRVLPGHSAACGDCRWHDPRLALSGRARHPDGDAVMNQPTHTSAAMSEIVRVAWWSLRALGCPVGAIEAMSRVLAYSEALDGKT